MVALGALALLLWEPHLEGRNDNATTFQIYFNDPFLAYVYTASIAFFVMLYQAFKLLGYIGRNEVFSKAALKALKTIKYCAIIVIGFVFGAEAYLFFFQRGKDDIAGGMAIGHVMIVLFVVIATTAAVFERPLRKGIEMQSENDLTV